MDRCEIGGYQVAPRERGRNRCRRATRAIGCFEIARIRARMPETAHDFRRRSLRGDQRMLQTGHGSVPRRRRASRQGARQRVLVLGRMLRRRPRDDRVRGGTDCAAEPVGVHREVRERLVLRPQFERFRQREPHAIARARRQLRPCGRRSSTCGNRSGSCKAGGFARPLRCVL